MSSNAGVVLVVLSALPFLAEATGNGFDCPGVGEWVGPRANNSITDCLKKGNYGVDAIVAVPMFFPLFIAAIVVLSYPLTMLCRYACDGCGSNRRRPGTLCCGGEEWDHAPTVRKEFMYSVEEVRRIKICAIVGFILSFVGLTLTVVGHNDFTSFYDYFDSYVSNTIKPYYNVLSTEVTTGLQDDTGAYYPPVSASSMEAFTIQVNSIQDEVNDIKDKAKIFRDVIYNGANVMAIAVILLFGLVSLYAALDVRSFFPALTSCFSFLLVLVLAVFGAGLFYGKALLTNGCEERDLQSERSPGVLQWKLVPQCAESSRFGPLLGDVATVESNYAQQACGNLFNLCDANAAGSTTFYCPNRSFFASASNCNWYANVTFIMTNMVARNAATACTGSGTSTCTISECKDYCTNTNDASNATRLVQYNTVLSGVDTAYINVQNLGDCNAQYDRVLLSLAKCGKGKKGMVLIGSGATVGAYLAAWSIYILLRGQKRFFKHGANSKKKYRIRRRKRKDQDGNTVTVEEASTYVPGESSMWDSSRQDTSMAASRQPYV